VHSIPSTGPHSDGAFEAFRGDGDLSGRDLAGYRILRRLGGGAMGDVYLAEQLSLGRRVAVKTLRLDRLPPGKASRETGVQRFLQEARAAAALVHGNIVQIHEVGQVDGIHFIAEEYVAGPSLRRWLAVRGPLDAAQAVSVLVQAAAALERAAGAGIVHRDIKPENLLLTPAGELKVADFGLARLMHADDDTALTQAGLTLGTPLYMSPEQVEGRPIDPRSDLYSLGATLWHLLAGRPPVDGQTSLAVAVAHVKGGIEPLERIRPDLPRRLCESIDRLLARSPDDRHESAAALSREVQALAQDLGITHPSGPLPLAWIDDEQADRAGLAPPSGGHAAPSHRAGAGLQPAATVEVRTATMRLQQAMDRGRLDHGSRRRFWLTVVALAVTAFGAGFAAARLQSRRAILTRLIR
jgi:serine/threonine-protein kinase